MGDSVISAFSGQPINATNMSLVPETTQYFSTARPILKKASTDGGDYVLDYTAMGGGEASPASYTLKDLGIDTGSVVGNGTGDVKPPPDKESGLDWFGDKGALSGIAGLGSVLVQAANLPSQIDLAKTQTKALKQNIATAKEEQARRNRNISSFNAHRTPTSAFV